MFKLLKWDFLNFLKQYAWLYCSFAIVLSITTVVPDQLPILSIVVDGMGALYSMFFYSATIILSVVVPIDWLRKHTALLELSLPVQPWRLLLSKLVLAVAVNFSGLVLTNLLWKVIHRFGMSNIVLFREVTGFLLYLTGMMTLIVIFMFSYITAKSFGITRHWAMLATALLSLVIPVILSGLVLSLYYITGVCKIGVGKYGSFCIALNHNPEWLTTLCITIAPLALLTAAYLGSSALLERQFERY